MKNRIQAIRERKQVNSILIIWILSIESFLVIQNKWKNRKLRYHLNFSHSKVCKLCENILYFILIPSNLKQIYISFSLKSEHLYEAPTPLPPLPTPMHCVYWRLAWRRGVWCLKLFCFTGFYHQTYHI